MQGWKLADRVRDFARVTVLLLALAPTAAFAAFTKPVTLSTAHLNSDNAQVAIDANGNAVVVWRIFDGTNYRIHARRRSAAGALGPILAISNPRATVNSAVLAEDGKGNTLIVWPGSDGHNTRIQCRTLSATGTLGPIVFLSAAGEDAYYPALAMNAAGRAIIVWSGGGQIKGRIRAGSGALSTVQNFSVAGPAFGPQVAITSTGDAVAVWDRSGRIELRARTAAGALKPVQILSSASYNSGNAQLALDGAGNALVVWSSNISSKLRVQARARSAAGALSAVQNVSAAGVHGAVPQVAVRSNGNALIVWETKLGGGVLARARAANGTLGSVQTISAEQVGAYPQFAMDKNGNALIAWEGAADFFDSRRIKARVRSASGALGAVQTLSADFSDAFSPDVAVKPAGGGAVAWHRSDGSNTRIQMSVGP